MMNRMTTRFVLGSVIFVVLLVVGVSSAPLIWTRGERAADYEMLKITFAVKQNDRKIESLFNDIALPEGSQYRMFFSLIRLNLHDDFIFPQRTSNNRTSILFINILQKIVTLQTKCFIFALREPLEETFENDHNGL